MMDLLHRSQPSFLQTHLTQRVRRSVAVADSFPSPTVLLVAVSRAAVLVVPFPGNRFMLLTVLPVREVWTAGVGAGAFWFLWHAAPRFPGKRKALQDCSRKACSLSCFSDSSAIAYVGITGEDGKNYFGIGIDHDIIRASIDALESAMNRSLEA